MLKLFKTWYFLFTAMPLFLILLSGCEKDEPDPGDFKTAAVSSLAIYPNPSNGIFYVDSNIVCTHSVLFNAMGQAIKGEVQNNSIDLSAYPAGIYFLRAMDENGNISVSKLIKTN
jgi:hypothetical protein